MAFKLITVPYILNSYSCCFVPHFDYSKLMPDQFFLANPCPYEDVNVVQIISISSVTNYIPYTVWSTQLL